MITYIKVVNVFECAITELALLCLLNHLGKLIRKFLVLLLSLTIYGAFVESLTGNYIIFFLVLVHIHEAPFL